MPDANCAAITSLDPSGAGLRMEFSWQGDRFAHKIFAVDRSKSFLLASSLEGDADSAWPASPPLQYFDDSADPAQMAIGAGSSAHWAVAIQPAGNASDAAPSITLDVACRVKQRAKWLGSSYQIANTEDVLCDSKSAFFHCAAGKFRMTTAGEGSLSELLHLVDGRLTIAPPANTTISPPATIRWRYRIEKAS